MQPDVMSKKGGGEQSRAAGGTTDDSLSLARLLCVEQPGKVVPCDPVVES